MEHKARMRDQGEKDEAERLLDQVSKGVRAVADAKQRAENKRALSARARELDAARRQAERCGSTAASATNTCAGTVARFSSPFLSAGREQAQRDEEAAAARAVAAARDRERVQFRDAEFQQKRAHAAAVAREEEEEERRRAAALQALADTVAPTVEADPRRVLQVFWFWFWFGFGFWFWFVMMFGVV